MTTNDGYAGRMPESMLLAAAAGALAGALAVGVVILLRRIVVASKDLGTDVEQATYQTLHLASRAAKHLRKGRNLLVEGRLQTRVWADARGNKHITAEIRADRILFLGSGRVAGASTDSDPRGDSRERPMGAEVRS